MASRKDRPHLGKAPASAQPERLRAGGSTVITGHLAADAIEGRGAYLETADGRRYEVIWPAGWRLDRARLALIDDRGRAFADATVAITVHGTIAGDIASIRQIGPIIRATTVELGQS
jgi:hypothetical protein